MHIKTKIISLLTVSSAASWRGKDNHFLLMGCVGCIAEEARKHVRHTRRRVVRSTSKHHRWNHHRQLSEPAAAPPCCCDSAVHLEVLVGAATLQAASSAAAVLTAQLPQAVAGAQQGACLALAGPTGLTSLRASQSFISLNP